MQPPLTLGVLGESKLTSASRLAPAPNVLAIWGSSTMLDLYPFVSS